MTLLKGIVLLLLFWGISIGTAEAQPTTDLVATVSIQDQQMRVYERGTLTYAWTVSTASSRNTDCEAGRCATPVGTFQPTLVLDGVIMSKKWNSAMYSPVFFDHDGDAVHGTDEVDELGKPASHGCVRLDPKNAKIFHDLVVRHQVMALQPPGSKLTKKASYPGVTINIIPGSFPKSEQAGRASL